ncbi:MAG: CRISPR-associated ring nuclease, partial [Bacillota bacterium]
VTIALDCLLAQKRHVCEVAVVHTGGSGIAKALAVIEGEFLKGAYPGIRPRSVPVQSSQGLASDFCTEEDLRGLLRTLYREVRRARQDGYTVNLCISGGRKVMGITGMVVAQLLFGPDDCVWHLVTEGWQPGSERRMHLSPEEKVWLVPVPVLRWSQAGTLMRTAAELDDPAEVVAWYERLSRNARMKRKGEFIRHWLSKAEREVVRLACRGLDNAAIAKALYKSEQTVANQLRNVYEKLKEWLDYPPHNVDRNVLIAEFAPYFSLTEEDR